MLDRNTEACLTSHIDQGGMAIRKFIQNNGVDEVLDLMPRFGAMINSDDAEEILLGTLCLYALAVALRDESAAVREKGGA
jgi:hypothetical protein